MHKPASTSTQRADAELAPKRYLKSKTASLQPSPKSLNAPDVDYRGVDSWSAAIKLICDSIPPWGEQVVPNPVQLPAGYTNETLPGITAPAIAVPASRGRSLSGIGSRRAWSWV
ncbi:hypothetical protein [Pseudomonas alloputida]|uniref:hypothetical protein n=1 Tax=Pseudomonas TaxID=286 RepID=UPI003EEC8EC4